MEWRSLKRDRARLLEQLRADLENFSEVLVRGRALASASPGVVADADLEAVRAGRREVEDCIRAASGASHSALVSLQRRAGDARERVRTIALRLLAVAKAREDQMPLERLRAFGFALGTQRRYVLALLAASELSLDDGTVKKLERARDLLDVAEQRARGANFEGAGEALDEACALVVPIAKQLGRLADVPAGKA